MLAKNGTKLAFSINNILQDGESSSEGDSAARKVDVRNGRKNASVKSRIQPEENLTHDDDEDDDLNGDVEVSDKISDSSENGSDDVDYEADENTSHSSQKSSRPDKLSKIEHTEFINSQDLSPQYKQIQEYYLSYCRNQLMTSGKSDHQTPFEVPSNEQQTEFSKNLLRLLFASSSSVQSPQSSNVSPSSIYNNLLLQWMGNLQTTNGLVQQQQQPIQNLDLTRGLLGSAESSLLDQKSHNYQKRIGHPYQNRNPPKRKKPRTSFNRPQIVELEKRFLKQKYLASSERSSLAKLLKMTDAQVKTWFQNRRTKWRRQNAEEKEAERQATNRLLMTLKQQQQQKTMMNVASVDISNLSSVSAISVGQSTDRAEIAESLGSACDEEVNPLNKLMMMEKAFTIHNESS